MPRCLRLRNGLRRVCELRDDFFTNTLNSIAIIEASWVDSITYSYSYSQLAETGRDNEASCDIDSSGQLELLFT